MKWIEISKAKVKFSQQYLVASKALKQPTTGILNKSETTAAGVVHTFKCDTNPASVVSATHVAIIADPNAPE